MLKRLPVPSYREIHRHNSLSLAIGVAGLVLLLIAIFFGIQSLSNGVEGPAAYFAAGGLGLGLSFMPTNIMALKKCIQLRRELLNALRAQGSKPFAG